MPIHDPKVSADALRALAVGLALAAVSACSQTQPSPQVCSGLSEIGGQVNISGGQVARATVFEPEERVGGAGAVEPFSIDVHEVTNAQYAAFVAATNYVTVAERLGPDGARLGAAVFDRDRGGWRIDANADWRHPDGAGSSIEGRDHYPVVAVAFEDAEAYARWAGRRLPTENEWEFAMRGGAPAPADVSQEAFDASGRPLANTWQGVFPIQDSGEDGFRGLAPVGCFQPNARGLYDMIGNVWEWTSDRYEDGAPQAPARSGATEARVLKGGSNLCARNFCSRFRSGSRQPGDVGLGMSHIGFRTAADT